MAMYKTVSFLLISSILGLGCSAPTVENKSLQNKLAEKLPELSPNSEVSTNSSLVVLPSLNKMVPKIGLIEWTKNKMDIIDKKTREFIHGIKDKMDIINNKTWEFLDWWLNGWIKA